MIETIIADVDKEIQVMALREPSALNMFALSVEQREAFVRKLIMLNQHVNLRTLKASNCSTDTR